jgi:hypothetical protein
VALKVRILPVAHVSLNTTIMNLVTYNNANSRNVHTGRRFINFHLKAGLITLSKRLVDDLSNGKKGVLIHQDQYHPKDWYLEFTDQEDSFLFRKKRGSYFSNKKIAASIKDSLDIDYCVSFYCLVGREKVKLGDDRIAHPIITKSVKVRT